MPPESAVLELLGEQEISEYILIHVGCGSRERYFTLTITPESNMHRAFQEKRIIRRRIYFSEA